MASLNPQQKGDALARIDGLSIGDFEIGLHLKPLHYRVGWTHFSLYLKDLNGRTSSQRTSSGEWVTTPVVEGIHSRGGRGVKGWIEVGDYFPIAHFRGRGSSPKAIQLSGEGLDREIFRLLGECVPAGGHLMFAYEVSFESPFHKETQESLIKGVPPVTTAQGELLFHAGFRLVKDWYLAEGGHEGPRKLWGEKPLNDAETSNFDLKTFLQLLAFLSRQPNPAMIEREQLARRRTVAILQELDLEPGLSTLRQGVIHIYQEDARSMALERAARRTCHQIGEVLRTALFKDNRMTGELSQISRECSRKDNGAEG